MVKYGSKVKSLERNFLTTWLIVMKRFSLRVDFMNSESFTISNGFVISILNNSWVQLDVRCGWLTVAYLAQIPTICQISR